MTLPFRPQFENTALSPEDEREFRMWARMNQINDVDHPESRYDYRGYWKNVARSGADQTKKYSDGIHFPDTYKQHGHPTFSMESQYSRGPRDGGSWGGTDGETFVPEPGPRLEDLVRDARGDPTRIRRTPVFRRKP
jgi:hypothetical protein